MRFTLPFDEASFTREIVMRITEAGEAARAAFEAEFHRQIRTRVLPQLKQRTPVRTGTLKRSTRYERTRTGQAGIRGRFYGAFLKPSQRQVVMQIFNSLRPSIYAACTNAARRAVANI